MPVIRNSDPRIHGGAPRARRVPWRHVGARSRHLSRQEYRAALAGPRISDLCGRVGVDAALLFAGHWLLRSFGLASRLAYGLMGGAAAAVGYAFALSQNLNFFRRSMAPA